jgi:signal peptidase I
MSAAMPTTEPELVSAPAGSLVLGHKARTPARSILRQGLQCLGIVVLAVASYFVISRFLVQSVKVVGCSMVPTLRDSQFYLLNRWVYHVHAPRRADVVVLRDPSDNGYSVKRVIAIPGDTVYLTEGKVYLNGCLLDEAYLAPGTPTYTSAKSRDQLMLCGKNQFVLLGDNRQNSIDSRTYGVVPRANILGPIVR